MAARRGLIALFALGCGAAAPASVAMETPARLTPPCRLETELLDVSAATPELIAVLASDGEVTVERVLRIASCGATPELLVVELRADERGYGTSTAAIVERAGLRPLVALTSEYPAANACYEGGGSSASIERAHFRDTCRGGERELWLRADLHDELGCPPGSERYEIVCSADDGLSCVAILVDARSDGDGDGDGRHLRVEAAGDCRVRTVGEGGRVIDLHEALATGGIVRE